MNLHLTDNQIIQIANFLGITFTESKSNYKHWRKCYCPVHESSGDSSAINTKSGIINCFSCGYRQHILQLLKERVNIIDFPEFLSFIELNFCIVPHKTEFYVKEYEEKELIKKTKNYDIANNSYYNFITLDIKVENFKYLVDRGFTNSFCKEFNIKHVISGYYSDYFAIPIIDTAKDIVTLEYRKIKEDVCFKTFFKKYLKKRSLPENYKKVFKDYCKEKEIKIINGKLYKKREQLIDSNTFYLLKPKTLYERQSAITLTLWNIDNLNVNEDLYVCEGLGSIAKIYLEVSKNVTCTFGSNGFKNKEQIEYLKKFKKKIILIPDNDKAGDKMIIELNKLLPNLYICKINYEDTDKEYTFSILTTEIIPSNKYLSQKILISSLT